MKFTIKRFFVVLFLQWAFLITLKYYFFGKLNLANPGVQNLLFWISVFVIVFILVRNLGVINYLEAMFIAFVWILLDALLDLIILTSILGYGFFSQWQYWIGYLVLAVVMFFFHKKRHVLVRQEIKKQNLHL